MQAQHDQGETPTSGERLRALGAAIDRRRAIWGQRPPLLLTHRTPDPDALGALVGLRTLLRTAFGLTPEVATTGRIFRAENRAMVRELDLGFIDADHLDAERFADIFLVDTQPGFGHTPLPEGHEVFAVFDHHEPQPGVSNGGRPPEHVDVRLDVGSTSAMIYSYLRDAGVPLDPHTATALCCGVRFDTADLSHHSSPLDEQAFHATFTRADRGMLARITRPTLPASYYRELHRSLTRARSHGPLVFGLLGEVTNPESVAEMADFFLRMEGCRISLVGGAFEGTYHLSLRTETADAFALLTRVIRDEGSFGGRGPVAGGQMPLETGEPQEVRRLQRRLRARALKLVDPAELGSDASGVGRRLLRDK